MIDLSKYSVEITSIKGEHKKDLLYHEGPLLSHFQDQHSNHCLYKWCDIDDVANRWLIIEVEKEQLIQFFEFETTLQDIILENKNIAFQDIDTNGVVIAEYTIPASEVPDEYLPSKESFYKETMYEDYAKELYQSLINNNN